MNVEARRLLDMFAWLTGTYSAETPELEENSFTDFTLVKLHANATSVANLAITTRKQHYGHISNDMLMYQYGRVQYAQDLTAFQNAATGLGLYSKQVGTLFTLSYHDFELDKTYRYERKIDTEETEVIWFRNINAKRHNSMMKPAPRAQKVFVVRGTKRADGKIGNLELHAEKLVTPVSINSQILTQEERNNLLDGNIQNNSLLCLFGIRDYGYSYWYSKEVVPLAKLEELWSNQFLESEFNV